MFLYLNINSISNKFDSVTGALVNYVDIFIAAEAKISESFPTAQFAIDEFYKPLMLDVTNKITSLLVYARSYLPLRQLTNYRISPDIQALLLKLICEKRTKFS